MPDIYDRQESLNLNTNQKIIVVGVGGVGWSLAKGLAMAGVDEIVMFDDDIVEVHNLPRLDVPYNTLGKNKATLLKDFIDQMRPGNHIIGYPFRFNPVVHDGLENFDWFVDCTDNHESQLNNQQFARDNGLVYMKVGYNGFHFSINSAVAEWDTNPDGSQDGYTIIPSFIAPAQIVAGFAIYKILTNSDKQIAGNIEDFFNF